MSGFNDREKGFEAKYRMDEEMVFKIHARRDKLMGLWAAAKMGITGADAEEYAKSIVMADMEEPGDDDVLRKLTKDFAAKGVSVSDADLRNQLDIFKAEAQAQLAK
jgi:hypothetical protein